MKCRKSSVLISLEILKDMDPAKIKPAVKDLKGLILYNLLFEIFCPYITAYPEDKKILKKVEKSNRIDFKLIFQILLRIYKIISDFYIYISQTLNKSYYNYNL